MPGRLRLRARLLLLKLRNIFGRSRVIGSTPVAVSLTSYGSRLESVFLTIESIGQGLDKPQKLILWLDDPEQTANLPNSLKRLQARGLEIRMATNFGPHTKYYPFVQAFAAHELPLVTADDDVVYPNDWLRQLVDAHRRKPHEIHCFRARQVLLDRDWLRPYSEWPYCQSTEATPTNFLTGVSGVIYPPEFLELLRGHAPIFMKLCPKADDVWLNVVALRAGVPVRQLRATAMTFPLIPGSQDQALWPVNMHAGGNDRQIRATYTDADLRLLRAPDQRATSAVRS